MLGIAAPGLQLAQIHGQLQGVQPDLQPVGGPGWQRHRHGNQQSGEQAAQQTARQVAA